ncbi:MAG: hypothetical protein AAF417_06050 [Pseudomonadota bacterium]
MSLLSSLAASVLIGCAAWLGLRKRYWLALCSVLAAVVPLLLASTVAKAVFVWLGLIGPIVTIAVLLEGLRAPRRG